MEGSRSDEGSPFGEVTGVEDLIEAERDPTPPDPEDLTTEVLNQTRVESQESLERQLDLATHIDDVAMRNARTSVIVISIIASAAGIAKPSTLSGLSPEVSYTAATGIISLTICVFTGLGTVFSTDREFGVGDSFREEAQTQEYSENEWMLTLLDGYNEWTDSMNQELRRGNLFLVGSQFLLFFGIAVLLISALFLLL
ncbi:hypothetical protein [Haloarcula sp. CBA1122]|uniref:hypothetical protein n=2 Tax=Haloarcula TaxID=2237 RepID=UPI0013065B26|nr:hypothetical protein [Haloarcula sp. CBA1122]MUV51094.1 hypothetical protein [Haloarcula sp. CBA1122]